MSSINQPLVRKGVLVRRIDNALQLNGNISQVFPMGPLATSCQFASSDANIISITESGKYRITFNGYCFVNTNQTGSNFSQFRLETSSGFIGYIEASGGVLTNTFSVGRYLPTGSGSLQGTLPTLYSPGGLFVSCNIMATTETFLNASDYVRFYIARTGVNQTTAYALNGYIFVEQIS